MSIENLEKMVQREIDVQRRGRFYLAGFGLAVMIILAAMIIM